MTPLDRSRLIARIFSRPVLEEIARLGSARHVVAQLTTLGVDAVRKARDVGDLFGSSLDHLSSHYRCEYVYKAALADRIVFGRHSPRTASMALELGVAGSIVDVAVFNGTSTAYEIKTELDSVRRLVTQTPAYLRAFECVNIVTHPSLVERYTDAVDPRVGILALSHRNQLTVHRAATPDLTRIEPRIVYRMLHRQEYIDAVCAQFGPQPQLPNGVIDAHYARLFAQLASDQAHHALVAAMRRRTTDAETVTFLSKVPRSLRAVAYATPLSRPQRQRVLGALAEAA